VEEPRQKEPDLVNVVSPLSTSASDRDELEGLIGVLGLRANFLPTFATADSLKRSSAAVASTSVCLTYGEYFLSTMSKRYGIPYTRAVMPVGIENTDQWLLQLAALVGKTAEAEAFIASEHERILP
jgi:nitrogenase molybdenum-iron protein alpha chain